VELSPARQKLLFVVIVVVLAVLGYYLVLPALHHTPKAAGAVDSPSPSPSTAAAAPLATVVPPTSAPVATPSAGAVNIYNWLPFTEQNLVTAAQVTRQFCVDYDTYTYTESASTYIGKLSGLVVSGLGSTLEEGYETPGTASLRTGQKEISSATASIVNLRAFGPGSLTFVATITQHLVSSKGTTNASTQFAVTLTGSGNSWQVNDIEPAQDGNS
jgi:hypothetical protein